jgi:uncharacterized protein (DUF1501 family)
MTMIGRRRFLALSGVSAATLAAPRLTAAAAGSGKRLALIILRGGWDGLSVVAPLGDPDYRRQRSSLALSAPGMEDGALPLTPDFVLHPALAPVHGLFKQEQLAVVQAVATAHRGRSHFDAQDILESGHDQAHASQDGWLNRAIGVFGGSGTRRGVAVGQGVPLVLRGPVPVASWAPSRLPTADDDFLDRVATLYANDALLARALGDGIRAQDMGDAMVGSESRKAGRGDAQAFRSACEAAGAMLADPTGPSVAVLELGGWDTHSAQGTVRGRLALRLNILAEGLARLNAALAPVWDDTAVVVVSEFGRTVAMNGSQGSDHGTAGVALVMGGAVRGGRVVADWPGLAPHRLFEGRDLRPTMDIRSLFKAVMRDHMGVAEGPVEDMVFPGSRAVHGLDGLFRA